MSNTQADQIELLMEVYTYWLERLSFYRSLGKATLDAEVSCELAEKTAAAEMEVARLQGELKALDSRVTFDSNSVPRWPEGA